MKMCPTGQDSDLHVVDRDKMACALQFLQQEYWQANERLHEVIQEQI